MCALALDFFMFIPCWNSVSNHNRQIIASNANVHTHTFCLAGDYAPNLTERRIHSAAARSANALEGDAKTPTPLQGCNESLHPNYFQGLPLNSIALRQMGGAKHPFHRTLYPMVCFRAEGVVNHDTLVCGVVSLEIGPTLEMGWQYTIPSDNMSFLKRAFQSGIPLPGTIAIVCYALQGALKVRIPLLCEGVPKQDTHDSNWYVAKCDVPPMEQNVPPHCCSKQGDAPKQGIPFAYYL